MSNDKRCCPTDAPPAACHYSPVGDDMYVVGPLDAKAGILLVSDIFGMLDNSKRLADELAKAGFLVIMPDYLGKKAWLEDNFPPKSFEDPEWLAFYSYIINVDNFRPASLRAIDMLKKFGCKQVGTVGMCWGALVSLNLAISNHVDAVASPHPSFLTPEMVSAVKTPICLLPSIDETGFEKIQEAFNALPVELKVYKHYQTLRHGFLGSRFDFTTATEEERKDCTEAKDKIIDFFKAALLK